MLKMFQQMNKRNTPNLPNPETITPDMRIVEKLNYQNYTTWYKLMQIALDCRGRLSHIIANPLSTTDPTYPDWKQKDFIVLSWIISNIDTKLINQFLDYTIARDLWKGIRVLLCSGRDELQTLFLVPKQMHLKKIKTHHNLEAEGSTDVEPNDSC